MIDLNEFRRRVDLLVDIMEAIPNFDILEKYGISSQEYRNDFKYVLDCHIITKVDMIKLNVLYDKYTKVK